MKYIYGEFSDNQIEINAKLMHGEIHKLLLYKDPNFSKELFKNDDDFFVYFRNLLYRFGGLNELLKEPPQMVALMSTLQAAYDEASADSYKWNIYRRLILDAHGYVKAMFEDDTSAES